MFVANLPYLGASLIIVIVTTIGIFLKQINICQAIVFYVIGFNELLKRVAQVIKVNTQKSDVNELKNMMSMFGNLPFPEDKDTG